MYFPEGLENTPFHEKILRILRVDNQSFLNCRENWGKRGGGGQKSLKTLDIIYVRSLRAVHKLCCLKIDNF